MALAEDLDEVERRLEQLEVDRAEARWRDEAAAREEGYAREWAYLEARRAEREARGETAAQLRAAEVARLRDQDDGDPGPTEPDDAPRPVGELHGARLAARLLTRSQLAALPPPEPLIDGVCNRDTLVAVYGKPGGGKSFLALDFGLSVATGTPWLGRRVLRGRVLYVAAEGLAGLPRRVAAWERARGVGLTDDAAMVWLPNAVNLLQRDWVDGLELLVGALEPVLIVIDTLARSMAGGDENGGRDMGAVIEAADRLRQATGATVLLVHHTPKDGGTLRGHSSLEGAVDTAIEVRSEDRAVTVTSAKQKDMEDFDDVKLVLHQVGDSCAFGLLDHCHGSDELTAIERQLLDGMAAIVGSDGLAPTVLMKAVEMPERSFYRARKALLRRGLITNTGTPSRPRYALTSEAQP